MPMNNTLNVSELLKRLGVVGDSQASASLLDQMRMSLIIGDLSQLIPPLRGPMAAGSRDVVPGVGNLGNWTLQCLSQGGLQIIGLNAEGTSTNVFEFEMWITDTNPWAAPSVVPLEQLAFGQVAESVMTTGTPVPALAPLSAVRIPRNELTMYAHNIWLGPGQFFNIEHEFVNSPTNLAISWMEFTGALNP